MRAAHQHRLRPTIRAEREHREHLLEVGVLPVSASRTPRHRVVGSAVLDRRQAALIEPRLRGSDRVSAEEWTDVTLEEGDHCQYRSSLPGSGPKSRSALAGAISTTLRYVFPLLSLGCVVTSTHACVEANDRAALAIPAENVDAIRPVLSVISYRTQSPLPAGALNSLTPTIRTAVAPGGVSLVTVAVVGPAAWD